MKKWSRRLFLTNAAMAAAGSSLIAGNKLADGERNNPVNSDENGKEISYSRKVPVRYEADVAVLGGGIAGVSAACAAAKTGAKVILVERFAVTGGMLTTGGVANFCGQMYDQGEVFDNILTNLKKFNALG